MNQRQILFRGLTASNEWVEGDLFSSTSGKNTTYFILPKGVSYFDEYEQVKPESIGQFCGLHDKHGKRIFEGDVLKWTHTWDSYEADGEGSVEKSLNRSDVVCFYNESGFRYKNISQTISESLKDGAEIIGNIHTNPEPLQP